MANKTKIYKSSSLDNCAFYVMQIESMFCETCLRHFECKIVVVT